MDPLTAEPILIVGAPRSGTSLLRTMLNRHPSIGLCDETFFFFYVHSRQKAFGDLGILDNRTQVVDRYLETYRVRRLGLDQESLRKTLIEQGTDYERLFLALLEYQSTAMGKKRCGEKTPQHAYEVETLCRIFPRCRVIHLVRDPRDVSASLHRVPFGSTSTAANARTWVNCTRAAERISGRENFLRVHYETLVDQPEKELRRICEFVNEPYSEAMLKVDPDAKADHWWFQRAQGPLVRDRKEAWREQLSPTQVAIIEWVADDLMVSLGYEPTAQAPGLFPRAVSVVQEKLLAIRNRVLGLPQLYYHLVSPTQLAAEESWIDRHRNVDRD